MKDLHIPLFKSASNKIRCYFEEKKILKPSIMAMLAAILSIPVLSIGTEYLIDEHPEYYLKNTEDIHGYMSQRAQQEKNTKPSVFNIGSSSLLRALYEDFRLEEALDHRAGFYTFTYDEQAIIEGLAILKKAKVKPGDLIVIHTSISRINRKFPFDNRICEPHVYPIYYKDMVETLANSGYSINVSKLCKLTFVSKRKPLRRILRNMLKNAFGIEPPDFKGIYDLSSEENPLTEKTNRNWKLDSQEMQRFKHNWLELPSSSSTYYIKAIKAITKFAKTAGAKLILLDLPLNKTYMQKHAGGWFPFENKYKELIEKASKLNLTYYDFRDLKKFVYEDFYDQSHMVESGRKKFLPIYLKIIKDNLGLNESKQ